MGGRGGTSGMSRNAKTISEVTQLSTKSVTVVGSVYLNDGIHIPSTHRQKELPDLLSRSDFTDFVLQTNNDKRGDKIVEQIQKMGFDVKRQYKQKSKIPYLRNFYYMKRVKK